MRRRQNTLLAGIAALALVAGTGISLAQQTQSSQGGTQSTTGASTSSSTQGGSAMQRSGTKAGTAAQANSSGAGKQGSTAQQKIGQNGKQQSTGQAGNRSAQNAQQGKAGHGQQSHMNRTAQNKEHGQQSHMNRTAQNKEKGQGATMQSRTERNAALQEHGRTRFNTAQEYRRGERNRFSTAQEHMRGQRVRTNTAQERNGNLRGLQANTSIPMQGSRGGNINLSGQQRMEIDQVVDASNAPRADRVDFNVRVGTVVPRRSVRVVPVPETLVRIEPRWRGYEYFVYNNQVIVVSPRTMRIVAVLPA